MNKRYHLKVSQFCREKLQKIQILVPYQYKHLRLLEPFSCDQNCQIVRVGYEIDRDEEREKREGEGVWINVGDGIQMERDTEIRGKKSESKDTNGVNQ